MPANQGTNFEYHAKRITRLANRRKKNGHANKKSERKRRTDRSRAPTSPCCRRTAEPVLLSCPTFESQIHPGTPPSAKGIKLHRLKSPVYTHTDPFPCQVACKCHEILTISERRTPRIQSCQRQPFLKNRPIPNRLCKIQGCRCDTLYTSSLCR